MIRPIATELALFLAPFLLYAAFLIATRNSVFDWDSWPLQRLAWLTGIALVLVIASFIVLAEFSGGPPGATYVPARIEGGKLIPGEIK